MIYQEIEPIKPLAKFIKCFWILESKKENPSYLKKDTLLPDGFTELIFHYSERFKEFERDNTYTLQPKSFVYGQRESYIEIQPSGDVGIIGVRFYPGGCSPFLKFPICELINQAVNLEEIFGTKGRYFEDKIINSKDNKTRLEIIQNTLLQELFDPKKFDFLMDDFVNKIIRANGTYSIEKFSNESKISVRQIRRRFLSAIGIGPKRFSKIMRFQKTLRLIKFGQNNTLTSLIHNSNYFDQSHFIRDFKNLAGSPPKEFLAKTHKFNDFMMKNG